MEKEAGNVFPKSLKILLVEDDESLRKSSVKALRKMGHAVFEAGTAEEAIEIFKNEGGNFEVLFSDVNLPGKSGIQLADEIFTINPEIKIILTSGDLKDEDELESMQKKNYQFLPKPYNITLLLNKL
jgi:DNA-binding NtrC family response regulator